MQAIIRQAKANLRGHKLQAVLILLTLLAAATLLTLASSTFRTAQGAYDRLFRRINGAHLWLELNPARVTAEEAERLLVDLPNVEGSTGAITYLFARLLMGDEPEEIRLGEWPAASATVGYPLLMAGQVPRPGKRDAIALDRNMAAEFHLSVGDEVKLLTPAGRRLMIVSGLFITERFPPYPNYGPALAYVAPGARAELGLFPPSSLEATEVAIGLRLRDPPDPRMARQAAAEALPTGSIVSGYNWEDTRRLCESNVLPQRILLITFSLVAGFASGFLIANAIGGAVRAQTRQIGLLKAVGFTGRQLALVYLAEYLGLALVASLAGLAVGNLLAPMILYPMMTRFGETLAFPPVWAVLVTPLGTLLVTALFTLWPVRRAVRLEAVEAIRVGVERPRRRAARLPHIPLPMAVGLSDVLSQPLRSTLTALGLGIAIFALIAALALNATVQAVMADPTMGYLQDGNLFVGRPPYLPEAEARRLIVGQPDVVASYTQRWWSFWLPGEEEPLYAIFREGDLDAFRFPIIEGRMLEGPDEAVVGYGLARDLGLHPADRLTILLAGQSLTFRVVGTFRTSNQGGRMLILPLEALRQVRPDAETFMWVLKLHPGADAGALAAVLTQASNGLLEVKVGGQESLPGWVTSLQDVTIALALVLGGMAVIGVLNSVWMGVRERQWEFGMLKAVGMTPKQVTLSVLAGATGMALLGYAIGLPAGLVGIFFLIDAVARAVGFGPITPPIDGMGLALLLPGIVLIAAIGAFIPAHRAGRISVVDMLRYE